jgi:hypothetical protein
MNQSTIERLIIATDNTPKGQIKGKKVSGDKQRKTELYWTDVNRILRKKEKRIRYETHRIEAQPDEADTALENIYYANYIGQKDITMLPVFNSAETITIFKREPQQQEEERDQFSAWDDPVWEEPVWEEPVWEEQGCDCQSVISDISDKEIAECTMQGFYIYMPSFNGEPSKYNKLQEKFKEIQLACDEYRRLQESYQLCTIKKSISDDESMSDDKSYDTYDYTYDSHGKYLR